MNPLAFLAAIYEAPAVVALGPELAAITAGFAFYWFGELHLTPAGEAYLQTLEARQ